MVWQGSRRRQADPALTTYAWKQTRKAWAKQLPLLCARGCGHMITSDKKYFPGTKITNPRSLVVGHKLSRSEGRALGYSEQQLHDVTNTQPECWSCSSRSGSKMGASMGYRAQQAARARSQAARQPKPKPASKINTVIRQAAASDRW
jgi:hypothetical protein